MLRATREWVMSPTIAIVSPLKSVRSGSVSRKCRRRVNASSSAWVGCSWVPSPALRMCASTQAAACQGAPEA